MSARAVTTLRSRSVHNDVRPHWRKVPDIHHLVDQVFVVRPEHAGFALKTLASTFVSRALANVGAAPSGFDLIFKKSDPGVSFAKLAPRVQNCAPIHAENLP